MLLNQLLEYKRFFHSGAGYPRASLGLDPDRGPHARRELPMLLDGVKPAALVDNPKPYEPYVRQGKLIMKAYKGRSIKDPERLVDYDSWVIALPGEEQRVERIIKLLQTPLSKLQNIDLYHAKLGRLLGYTKEQVRKFINKTFDD